MYKVGFICSCLGLFGVEVRGWCDLRGCTSRSPGNAEIMWVKQVLYFDISVSCLILDGRNLGYNVCLMYFALSPCVGQWEEWLASIAKHKNWKECCRPHTCTWNKVLIRAILAGLNAIQCILIHFKIKKYYYADVGIQFSPVLLQRPTGYLDELLHHHLDSATSFDVGVLSLVNY